MTERDQALAHLRKCQDLLYRARRLGAVRPILASIEDTVLSALSWLWDVQEREQVR